MTILKLHLETDAPIPLAVAKTLRLKSILKEPQLLEDTFDEMLNSLTLARRAARRAWNKEGKTK